MYVHVLPGQETIIIYRKKDNMEKLYTVSAMIIAVILAACSTPKKTDGVWVNEEKIKGKSFSNIFIIVMTADVQARVKLEGDLAHVATSRGLKAVESIDVMPVDIHNPKMPSKDEVVSKVKASGCDAVFVASLLKLEESVDHSPGSTAYAQMPYYSHSGNYYGYYSNWYPTVSTPSYYSHDKTYFMQSNLYDVASEEIMWSVKSEVFSPVDIDKFSKSYTKTLISKLKDAKLLRK